MKKVLLVGCLAFVTATFPAFALAQMTGDVDTSSSESSCIDLKNNMRPRSYNPVRLPSRDITTNGEVSLLQGFLQDRGYLNSDPTGFFGNLTRDAIVKFQKESGITPSSPAGFVGGLTRAKIASMTGCSTSVTTVAEPKPALTNVVQPISTTSGLPTISSVEVIGGKSVYAPGEIIKFSAKIITTDGLPAGPDRGFALRSTLDVVPAVYVPIGGASGVFNSSTSLWDVTMTAPTDATKSYQISHVGYCGDTTKCRPSSTEVRGRLITFTVSVSPVSTLTPTVEFTTTPELILKYDSAGKESLLVGTALVKVTAGNLPLDVTNVARILSFANSSGGAWSNNMKFSAVGGAGLTVPANTSAVFYITNTVPTAELFAGVYSVVPREFQYIANGSYQAVPAPAFINARPSNAVTIVGEVSPYITAVKGNATNGGTIVGVRFHSSSNIVTIGGISKTFPAFGIGSGGETIAFKMSDFGLTNSGNYEVQVKHPTTGASNKVFAVLNAPVSTALTATLTVSTASIAETSGNIIVAPGTPVIFRWSTVGAVSCFGFEEGGVGVSAWYGEKGTSGTTVISAPAQTMKYRLNCSASPGVSVEKVITVTPTQTISTPVSTPTVEFSSTPELILKYDSTGKESLLVGTVSVKITAGNTPVNTNFVPNMLRFYKGGGSITSNNLKYSATGSTGLTIPANTSATFYISNTIPPSELFAGTYSLGVSDFWYQDGNGVERSLPPTSFLNVRTSNAITIVGEVSPYISSVSSDTSGNVTIKGVRLDLLGNAVVINGATKVGASKGDATFIWFDTAPYGLAKGVHYLQIINSQVGNSQKVSFDLNASSKDPIVEFTSTPELILKYDSAGKESLFVGTVSVKITAGNTSSVNTGNVANMLQFYKNGGSISSNGLRFSATGAGLTIPPSTSATFYISNTIPPAELFAGTYSLGVSGFTYNDGNNTQQYLPPSSILNVRTSNAITIVGEVSPYITSVGNDATPNVNVTISGVRFHPTTNTVSVGETTRTLPSLNGGTMINFQMTDFGLTSVGNYLVQVTHPTTGASNKVYANITNAPTPVTSAPTLTFTINNGSSATMDPNNFSTGWMTLRWSSINATECVASDGWIGMKLWNNPTVGEQIYVNQNKTFTLTCTGAGGSVTKSVTVTLSSGGTAQQSGGGSLQNLASVLSTILNVIKSQ